MEPLLTDLVFNIRRIIIVEVWHYEKLASYNLGLSIVATGARRTRLCVEVKTPKRRRLQSVRPMRRRRLTAS